MSGINYTLKGKINALSGAEQLIIKKNPATTDKDWSKACYAPIKQRIKKELILQQYDRCAYCRRELEAAGKYEPLEHIVPKTEKPIWMLVPKNLALCCDSCNNLKNANKVLVKSYETSIDYPELSEAYLIFHPHFDNWEDHFEFEDDIFIVAKTEDKGKQTIKSCKLYRFNVIINRAKELRSLQKNPALKIVERLTRLDTSIKEEKDILKEYTEALDYFINRMKDNPDYN